MKKSGLSILFSVLLLVFTLSSISALCDIDVSLVNQDPYPAVPGEYVKVVFQLQGAENSECGTVRFGIQEDYPFSLDAGATNEYVLNSGGYSNDPNLREFSKYKLIAYRLRIDPNAIDKEETLTTYHTQRGQSYNSSILNDFNIEIEDVRTDFEVHVKDYNPNTKEIIFEILNIGEEDIEALTLEIPDQENVDLIGSSRVILGDLDSNEEDSARITGDFREGDIRINLIYTDAINERRTVEEVVNFNPAPFLREVKQDKGFSPFWAFVIGLIIPIAYLLWKRRRDRKKAMHKHSRH